MGTRKGSVPANKRHGLTKTRFYAIWRGIRTRTENRKHDSWQKYGANGISMGARWLLFDHFMADMHKTYEKHCREYGERNTTIERIDSKGNYTPENCRWATRAEQAVNRSIVVRISHSGITDSLTGWGRRLGMKAKTIRKRLHWGFPLEVVLSKPRLPWREWLKVANSEPVQGWKRPAS